MNVPLFDSFDFEKRYNIAEYDNIVYIKIRFNDINDWNKILSEIFNREITIYPDNLTENKQVAELYKKFKEQYKVPKDYLVNHLPNDKMFKIYNTDEEQKLYINNWMAKSV